MNLQPMNILPYLRLLNKQPYENYEIIARIFNANHRFIL
jgi:hypothetical protein